MKKMKSFTLAEVLITLVIIGIIAAITVPVVMSNVQKQDTISKLKKVYAMVSQAANLTKIDNGLLIDHYIDNDSTPTEEMLNYFKNTYFIPYLQIQKECTGYAECGYEKALPWTTISGEEYLFPDMNNGAYYLLDGTFVALDVDFDWADLYIDINGPKKPNKYGRDVFVIEIKGQNNVNKVTGGWCSSAASVNNDCSSTGRGLCCLQKLINDNWEFKDDYLW